MSTFRETIESGQFAVAAELTVQRDSTADDLRRQADLLVSVADGIEVTDNPYAWVQMSALSAAGILREHGADPIPVLTCRDRNRLALESDLRGLHALGVSSLMLMRGHRVPKDHAVPASTVFDLSGRDLIALAASLGDAEKPAFLIGTGARVFRPNPGWRAESLTERGRAGAGFVQTQLCFNRDILQRYMRRFVEAGLKERYAVLVSLMPLPSAETARWVKRNLADSRIPAAVVQRLEEASDPRAEGIRICAEMIRSVAEVPGVSGVNLMTTGDAQALVEAVQSSGVRD